jgi:hypothetical protein
MPKVAIIVLNWNRPKLTQDTLNSILKITHKNFSYHIFLVDNGSTDNSLKLFQKEYRLHKNISILATGDNLGFVDGNNYAIKIALQKNFDYILVCNNDILVKADFLQNLVDTAKVYPNAIISPKIYFAKGYEFHKDRYQKSQLGKVIWSLGGQMDWANVLGSNIGVDQVDIGQFEKISSDLDFVSGCCLFAPAKIFKKIGLFDRRYFMYLEDVDFSRRALKRGFQLICQPKSIIWHLNAGSSSSGSQLQNYFFTRNRLFFARHFASLRARFALNRQAIGYLFSKNKWQRLAVIDFYLGRMAKGSWQ